MRRLSKIILISALGGVIVLSSGCSPEAAPAEEAQVVTVQRGDLRTDITGVGNLALSQKVDLAFELDGTVAEVLVAEAASVKEDQALVRLDTTAWDEQVNELEDEATQAARTVTAKQRAVTTAERNVTEAERNVTEADRNVTEAERNVTSKRYDLLQAQINLNNAKLSLEQTEETSTDRLEIQVKELQVELAKGRLEDAKVALHDAETQGIDDAKQSVEDAKVRLEDARIAVEDSQIAVADAQKVLADAQEALEEALNASPEIKAPFDGFITKVNVAGGDEIKKGTVAVTIADPAKFEAEVMVSEADILKVNLGDDASVQVEAQQGLSLPAKVTHIAPAAVIQQGVVNYTVTVEIESLQPQVPELPARSSLPSGNVPGGTPSRRLEQSFGSGNLTQEQIGQIMQQRQQALVGRSGTQPSPASGGSTEAARLAEGMTVTVSITTEERNGVLLVPTQAIISRGRATFVQVTKDGAVEERPVQTGISNWQYVEITSGLSEGEQIVVPRQTAPTPNTSQQRPQPPGGIPREMQRMLR